MKRLLLLVHLALTAAILLAQQPSTRAAQSPAAPPSSKPSPQAAAAPDTPAEQNAMSPDDGQFENLPDQNIDPSETAPPPPTDVIQQKEAVASMQKAIPAGSLSLAASLGKNILAVRVNGRDVRTFPVSVGMNAHQTPQGHWNRRRSRSAASGCAIL